jgi:hypothetical protein
MRQFPYLKLKQACLDWAIPEGFALSLGYVVSGVRNNTIERLIAERNGYTCTQVASFSPYIKIFNGPPGGVPDLPDREISIRAIKERDIPRYLATHALRSRAFELYEEMDIGTMLYQHKPNEFVQSKLITTPGHEGFISYQYQKTNTANGPVRTASVFAIFLEGFSKTEKIWAMNEILAELHHEGAKSVIVLNPDAFNCTWLHDLNFRVSPFSTARTNLYVTAFDSRIKFSGDETKFLIEVS